MQPKRADKGWSLLLRMCLDSIICCLVNCMLVLFHIRPGSMALTQDMLRLPCSALVWSSSKTVLMSVPWRVALGSLGRVCKHQRQLYRAICLTWVQHWLGEPLCVFSKPAWFAYNSFKHLELAIR